MHEMGVTRDLVDTVVRIAQERNAVEVSRVYLHIGFVRDIVDELLEGCFRWMARDTVAANAELIIERIPFTVQCNHCGLIYAIDGTKEETWTCPVCEERDYHLNSGMEFFISHLEMRFADQPQHVCA